MSYDGRKRVQRSVRGAAADAAAAPGRAMRTQGLVQRQPSSPSAVQLLRDPVQMTPVAPRPPQRGHRAIEGNQEGEEEAGGADRDHKPAITR